ncbi:unnamed protein product [Larinioides sclopetarius]|uniref:Uncharacterized protein n=1 Tax=Larinioides sclopetarius TaxID=280406 RepID=A0AAV2APJ2_9ARAC
MNNNNCIHIQDLPRNIENILKKNNPLEFFWEGINIFITLHICKITFTRLQIH